jgi:hypothetical protein
MLGGVLQSVVHFMPSIAFQYCYAERRFAECCYAECRGAAFPTFDFFPSKAMMTLSITTLSIMTLSIMTFRKILNI